VIEAQYSCFLLYFLFSCFPPTCSFTICSKKRHDPFPDRFWRQGVQRCPAGERSGRSIRSGGLLPVRLRCRHENIHKRESGHANGDRSGIEPFRHRTAKAYCRNIVFTTYFDKAVYIKWIGSHRTSWFILLENHQTGDGWTIMVHRSPCAWRTRLTISGISRWIWV